MQVVTTEQLENLYLQNRFDEMHELMSSKHEISTDVEDKALLWYGRLLETLGEDASAEKCYIRAGKEGYVDRLRHSLRQGCTIDEALRLVSEMSDPQPCAFLARYCESSDSQNPAMRDAIIRLYSIGNCYDYVCHYALKHGQSAIAVLLATIQNEKRSLNSRSFSTLLNYLEGANRRLDMIRIFSKTTDGAIQAAELALTEKATDLLQTLVNDSIYRDRLATALIVQKRTETILHICKTIQKFQLQFEFLYDCGPVMIPPMIEQYVFSRFPE